MIGQKSDMLGSIMRWVKHDLLMMLKRNYAGISNIYRLDTCKGSGCVYM